jgi:predicted regulator of Ras-like GTPase activity (Roadblock/LC7/MglB family)
MRLPAGTVEGIITNPHKEGLRQYLLTFRGLVEAETLSGHGFILNNNGKLVGAYFKDTEGFFRGKSALFHMVMESTGTFDSPQTFNIRKYTEAEFSRAVQLCVEEGLLITEADSVLDSPGSDEKTDDISEVAEILDENTLKKIKNLAGVIAVAAVFEGFSIQYLGDADFEHVAASAEDLLRAGTKIARDLNIGALDQMILETNENKFIIVPCGDLFLCVFTTADAHLGLIRVVLKNIQSEISGNK